jgi:lysophospholipase L1-like esterase
MPSSLSTSSLVATGSYIVTLNGALASNETIALTDASGGGIFTPSSLTFTPANAGTPQTFSYTPASGAAGTTKTLTATGGGAFSANHSASCVVSATASDFSLTPSSLSTNPAIATSNYTVTLNGPLAANETIVLSDSSGGGTFTPSSLTFTSGNAATPQTFTYTPSGGAGGTTKTLTATGSGAFSANHSASCAVSSGPQVVPVTNSSIFWSEGNWDHLTSGTFGVSLDTMQATAAGAYFKFNVSGTVNLSLDIDNSTTSSFPSGNMPIVSYIIDGGDRVDSQLQPSLTNFAISSSLSTGAHTVEVYLRSTSLNQGDRWGSIGVSPTNVLRIKGIVIDSAAIISASTLRSKRMVIYGDSRTECYNLDGSSQDYPVNGYGALMARALDAEWANVGYGSQGVTVAGAGNVPAMLTSYSLYSAGRARSATGVDYVTVLQGFNDNSNSVGGATIQTDVQALLGNLRTLYGGNTRIFWFYDPAGFYASNYAAAVAAYRTANPSDTKVYYIDISSASPVPAQFDQFSGATDYTADGVHFNQFGSGVLGAQYAAKIQTALGTTTTPTTPSHQLKRARS